ncbi:MAG TPA: hypothetical protein VH684_27215 [Xanthobacteraceae bacterium]|jgi:hypothetical protein
MVPPKTTWTKEEFWAELDEIGEDEVRVRLATKYYSDVNERGPLAREWLQRRELSRAAEVERSREASSLEHMRIARSAKNAAWTAAIAAMIAAMFAAVAIVISLYKP